MGQSKSSWGRRVRAWARSASPVLMVGGATVAAVLVWRYMPDGPGSLVHPPWSWLGAAAVAGALAALLVEMAVRRIAVVHPRLYERLSRARLNLGNSDAPLTIGGISVSLGDDELATLWPVYVELSTRIASNSLRLTHGKEVEHTGDLAAALKSLHSLFEPTRKALAACPPAGVAVVTTPVPTASQQLMTVLNQSVRPFLARWHPWLDQWKGSGLPERRWPAFDECREDLESVRLEILEIVSELAGKYEVAPPPVQGDNLQIKWHGRADDLDWGWSPTIDAASANARNVLDARVPPETVAEAAWLKALLGSWRTLATRLDEILVEMGPIPAAARLQPGEVRPDDRVRAWRGRLEPVLLRWEGPAATFGAETSAADLAECAKAVEGVRAALRGELATLARG